MKRLVLLIAIVACWLLPTSAQEELVCSSPFVDVSEDETIIVTLNTAQVSETQFANRIRFEHAYNAIKLEVTVTQLTQQAQQSGVDLESQIANNPQIQQINQETNDIVRLGNRILGDFATDAVIWAYADANDMVITEEQLNQTIADFFQFDEETPEERDTIINNFSQRILINGTPPSELTTFFCRQAVYSAVEDRVVTEIDTTLYADVDHILVSSVEVAQDIITLLQSGDDFATLAGDLSLDVASAERGGALGWQPVIFYVNSFGEAVRNAEISVIGQPVETRFGWHVIRVNAREERTVTGDLQQQIIQSSFTRWREQQISQMTIDLHPEWFTFIPTL